MAESHREEIAKLEALHANNPEGRVFTHLAEAYRKAGELERSREILERGLLRHGDYASAHVVLGRVLMDMGDAAAARASFRRVLELDRHNLIALRSLGDLASSGGERDEALRLYGELLSLDPGDERVRSAMARLQQEPTADAGTTATEPPAPAEPPAAGEPAEAAELTFEPMVFTPERDEATETSSVEAVSLNWEEDADVPQEPLPGDLAAFAVPQDEQDGVIAPGSPAAGPATDADWLAGDDWARMADSPEADAEAIGDTHPVAEPPHAWDPRQAAAPEAGIFAEARDTGTWPGAEPLAEEAPAPPADEPEIKGDEVQTETLAELYTAQGLHERAAEVYRSLLRDQPGDERLQNRLEDSEAAVRRGSAAWTTPTAASEADVGAASVEDEAEENLHWLERVESAWTGGAGVAGGGPTPYAWTDTGQVDEAGDGSRIADYFRTLLSWRPGSTGTSATDAETVGSDVDTTLLLMDEVITEEQTTPALEPLPPLSEEEGAQANDDDEDLDMFRSWLQSLKK